ncbi:hypothetical protein [Microbispora sp. H13382]|uniref:hypothetical protein n=1 Tax=Microbispora sp. H13382 TaxID=2729112 RepID=UPI001600C6B7|nr:hypothetical protein [Microbispora sp. H13382]
MTIPLSVGASPGQKTTAVIVSLASLVLLTVAAWIFFGPAAAAADDLPHEFGQLHVLVQGAFCLVAAVLTGMLAILLLRAFRSAARLTGTVLEVRGALETRRADLATAPVRLDSRAAGPAGDSAAPTGWRIPLLIAGADPDRPVTLRLRDLAGTLLPSPELHALAAAVESGTRQEAHAASAAEAAALLRRLADDPLARML